MDKDCLFCKIAKKQIPSEIIYEDGGAVAFLDIHPMAPGHAVVVPKVHHRTISDLGEKEVGEFFGAVRKVARAASEALHADGLNIGINEKAAAGQAVEHLHVHVLPRFIGDGGTSVHGIVNNTPKEPLKEIGKKIRAFFGN